MRKRNQAFLRDLCTSGHNYSLVLPTLVEINVSLKHFPSAWWPAQSPRRNHQGFLPPRILILRRHEFLFSFPFHVYARITYSRFPKPTTTVASSHLPTAKREPSFTPSILQTLNLLSLVPFDNRSRFECITPYGTSTLSKKGWVVDVCCCIPHRRSGEWTHIGSQHSHI